MGQLSTKNDRNPLTPAYYRAGEYYGIYDKNEIDKILQCFNPSDDLTNALYDCMDGIISHGQSILECGKLHELFKASFQDCGSIADELEDV